MLFRLHSRHKENSDTTSLADVSLRHYPPGVLPLSPPTPLHSERVAVYSAAVWFAEKYNPIFLDENRPLPMPTRANNALVPKINPPDKCSVSCYSLTLIHYSQPIPCLYARVSRLRSALLLGGKRSHHLCHFVQRIYTLFRIRSSAVGIATG
jgi:hypothetical protein